MTREEIKDFCDMKAQLEPENEDIFKTIVKTLEQEPCEDIISRKSIKQKLQEHHDFFVNAYGGFSNLPLNDKSRVDEITNCIAMVVNEPSIQPEVGHWIPVGERLPEKGYSVLVTRIIDDNCKYVRIASYQGDCWMDNTDEFNKPNPHKVIAWQSLSPCYEPQESEE